MKHFALLLAAAVIATPIAASAQLPVTAASAADQAAMLKSRDAKLAANKKLVYDMWRAFVVARHVDVAPEYFTEAYLQHNPNVPSGRDKAVAYFKLKPPSDIPPTIANLVNITAEGDIVTMATVRNLKDPKTDMPYTTAWFDMYRIENGKIAEHWDIATK